MTRPEITPELLADAAARRDAPTSDVDDARSLMVFAVAGTLLAVPVEHVHEVAPVESAAPIPLAPPHMRGFVLRGERAVVALDLARLLGLGDAGARDDEGGARERLLVVRAAGMEAGLVCARALGVVAQRRSLLGPPRALQGEALRRFLVAEADLPEGPVGLLDLERLLGASRLRAE